MNYIFLFLIGFFIITRNYKIIKSQKLLHKQIVQDLESQMAIQIRKADGYRNSIDINQINLIKFKVLVIKQQVTLLAEN